MKRFNYRNLLLAALLSAFSLTTLRAAGPVGLKCEYLVNPIGLDAAQPRFTWKVNDDRPGALQTAYKLSVYNDAAGKSLRWESGKVNAAAVLASYEGESLQPFTKYWWKVEIWDQDGKASVSPLATFETGMMGNRWQGQWISDTGDRDLKPAAYFRKAFHAKKKSVRHGLISLWPGYMNCTLMDKRPGTTAWTLCTPVSTAATCM
ncbi:hypothetical protein MKQ70_22070 [Chitinophaga sedimenti]|uniref:glycoside hydrolase family 78 protein n=1 Tax=Chitinophaga sedimenti TaxID=2033606 RepID=UPI0020048C1A|nr:hypothetical protein [Chitinophaga sedimenti]MCK7557540.1 hypothetical protein [Chitinophaga sedimenti]